MTKSTEPSLYSFLKTQNNRDAELNPKEGFTKWSKINGCIYQFNSKIQNGII